MADVKSKTIGRGELWWVESNPEHEGSPPSPDDVVASLEGRVTIIEKTATRKGLRAPQVGAVYALLARATLGKGEPTTIVLPTGTGKTETMLARFCQEPVRTIVVVPSDSLRTQIGKKFATLGILPEVGIVADGALTPAVAVLKQRLTTESEVHELADCCNVLVTTAAALSGTDPKLLELVADRFDQLFVDEAHHVVARTWAAISGAFASKRVVQFTATPFREDGQHLPGEVAYAYPLRLAQSEGYFAPINYVATTSFAKPDEELAKAAVEKLREDLAAGRDHILMARVRSVKRAEEVLGVYEALASDLGPMRIDSKMAPTLQRLGREALEDRTSRVVVCVDMLGEGFDLPALKVAAIHDPHRSLAVTLQFIGRFARTGDAATAFVPRQTGRLDDRLRQLYAEDSDWNVLVSDLSQAAVDREVERSAFDRAFSQTPDEVAIESLRPKMSTVMYRSPALEWNPDAVYDLFSEEELYTKRVAVNHKDRVLWFVTAEQSDVPWADIRGLAETVHHFYLVHADLDTGCLYINSSDKASIHERLAKAVGGNDVDLFKGDEVYRVLSAVNRRVPTNVGLLDAVSRNRRFTMLVGEDVLEGFGHSAAQKMKTNIFAHGYGNGARVTYGASRKGRVWSYSVAQTLLDWVQWATETGALMTDTTISLESVMSGFIFPVLATERPPLVALGVEWPYDIVGTLSEARTIEAEGHAVALIDCSLEIQDWTLDHTIRFAVCSDHWSLGCSITFDEDGPRYHVDDKKAVLKSARDQVSLSDFMNKVGMTVFFTQDALLAPDGALLQPKWDAPPFPPQLLEVQDWTGTNLRKESQGRDRESDSVQFRTIAILAAERDWDLIIDDDGNGEVADIVLLKRVEQRLEIVLAHCKFSHGDKPGARLADLYEVCGQAVKSHKARSDGSAVLRRLIRREQNRQARRGHSGLVKGTEQKLLELENFAHVADIAVTVLIAQPGLAKSEMTNSQSEVLASTSKYLRETFGSDFRVFCSP